MSWLLGFIGEHLTEERRRELAALWDDPLFHTEDEGLLVAGGGHDETLVVSERVEIPYRGWAVAGVGLERSEDSCRFVGRRRWQRCLEDDPPQFDELDGHFAIMRWSRGRIELYTDVLGLRPLYVSQLKDGVVVSTRPEWIAWLHGSPAIDVDALSSRWNAYSQLLPESLIENVLRVGPSGCARCTATGFTASSEPFTPDIGSDPSLTVEKALRPFVNPSLPQGTLSLGLSGGLDSRLLLALGHAERAEPVHVFGPSDKPDVRAASRIAEEKGLRLRHLAAEVPDADTCWRIVAANALASQAGVPASSTLGLRHYVRLHDEGLTMIDGGFGELGRRRFMNRLLRLGGRALSSGDAAALLPHLRVSRADIFAAPVKRQMDKATLRQVGTVWQELPDSAAIGAENLLDLLCARTKLCTGYAYEQSRLDGLMRCYMPYCQPSYLRDVFRMPLSRRTDRHYKRTIRRLDRTLAQFPLVLGSASHPFPLPRLPAHVYVAIKSRLGFDYEDSRRERFLNAMRPRVFDMLRSLPVRNEPLYDYTSITQIVEGYYGGDSRFAVSLDWWLSFEAWRRQIVGHGDMRG